MIDQFNELPEDGLKSSPETSRYTENKWISQKNQNELYFLQLIDILNDLLLICRYISYLYLIRSEFESNQQPFAHQYIYIYITYVI